MNRKEQKLAKKIISNLIGDSYMPAEIVLSINELLKLMGDYHKSKQINLRDELLKFYKWLCMCDEKEAIEIADEYLNQKDK